MNLKRISVIAALMVATAANATDLIQSFNSPAFNGMGYSSHVLTIEQLEQNRKQKIKDDARAAAEKAKAEAANTPTAQFLTNVQTRIYSQLAKQLTDQMFSADGATQGTMNFEGTNISWVKTGGNIELQIIDPNGSNTKLSVPIGTFGF